MTKLAFGRRLLVTTTGEGLGFAATLLAIAADRSIGIEMRGVGILLAAAAAGALVGAAATRRWVPVIVASILAGATVPAMSLVSILVACGSGICD
jgi:hypothetical protein